MKDDVIELVKGFRKKYPSGIVFRTKKHAEVIKRHLNDDEVVLFAFIGQKDATFYQPFYTTAVVFTNKRMLLGRSQFFGRYYYSSITPDMLNDFEIRGNILFGTVEIDTVKEHFCINCLDKKSLPSIEDALSNYLVNEKLKYAKGNETKNKA